MNQRQDVGEPQTGDERKQLEQAIAALEAQRAALGDAVVDPMIAAAREKLQTLTPAGPTVPELRGERRWATILMADVKGSTELAGQIGTEIWVEIMNRVFHLAGDAIYAYGGEIEQYRGDGLMAFFGAKAAHEDDPERAVRAGLAMQAAVIEYAAELRPQYDVDLLMRVGINSGPVIAAQVGDRRQHSEDTAMGRAIALAARIESAAQPGTVLVSAQTYYLTRPLFEWQAMGEVAAKGYSRPVTAYRPLAVRAVTGKVRGVEGLSSPLVGRDAELDALRAAVDGVRRGVGGIVTLVGEAGLGKSRLVAEVREWAREQGEPELPTLDSLPSGLQWTEGRCLSYGGSIAYLMWLDMLRSILRVAQDAPPEDVREALRGRVRALCPDRLDAVYPYLCRLLSLPLEDEYEVARNLQGESLRAEIFQAVLALIEGAARQQPLTMVCEDLHWADDTSLALLERVLALTDRSALLLVCVLRPEVEHGCWQLRETAARLYRHRHTDLWLDALSADESQVLVGHLLWVEDLPETLRARILERAEGNPFYVEEIIRALIDDVTEGGPALAYDETKGQWQAAREIAHIPVPDTLHGVLGARIDRLQAETRRVLRLSSVIGRVFSYRVLAEVAQDPQLDTRLLTLQRQQLIRERARVPEVEYIFKHELTREAAYDGLLDRERRACHRQVAETLERLSPEQADEQAGLLAYHWERAEEPQAAVKYLVAAGEQARLAYANQEAADYYQRALAAIDDLGPDAPHAQERLAALSGLGKVTFSSGRIADADGPLREAIELGKACGLGARELVRIYWWLGEVFFWQARHDEGVELAEEGLALLGEERTSAEAALMYHSLAISCRFKNLSRACACIQRSAEIIRDLPYEEEFRPIYVNAFDLFFTAGRKMDETERHLSAFERQARAHHDLRGLGEAWNWMGTFQSTQGALAQAIENLERAHEMFASIEDSRLVAWNLGVQSFISPGLGDLDRAERGARRWLEWSETLGSPIHRALALGLTGRLALCRGRAGEAIPALREAVDLAAMRQALGYEGLFARYLAQAYLATGRRQQALEQLHTPRILDNPYGSEPALVKVLSLVEQACERPQEWSEFRSWIQEHCLQGQEARYAPFVCWRLKAVEQATLCPAKGPGDGLIEFRLPGWTWVDPLQDCAYRVEEGLEIRATNGRDLWYVNRSAPRLLRQASGDVVVEATSVPARDDRPAIGGLLLWEDEKNYLRLDRGVSGVNEIAFVGCVDNQDVIVGRGRLYGASDRIVLRLERVGEQVRAFCRVEGGPWYTVGHVAFSVADPIHAGLHAIGYIDRTIYPGAHPHGTAIRFESVHFWAL